MSDTRTKADFKALRESVGMSQAMLARQCSVEVQSIKNWEQAKGRWQPTDSAWAILDTAREQQLDAVASSLNSIYGDEDAHGMPDIVNITYYQNKEAFHSAYSEKPSEEWRMANANARVTATVLELAGYKISFNFCS